MSRTITDTVVVGDVDVRTIRAALEALPRRPRRVEILDDHEIPADVRKEIADMDAFVLVGSQTVCVRRQSRTLREAEFAGGHFTLMLSLVIWHEMAHAEGLDEGGARRREEALWREYVRNGRVDRSVGLEYLRELEARK